MALVARGREVAHPIARPETLAYSFWYPKSVTAGGQAGTESMFKESINIRGRETGHQRIYRKFGCRTPRSQVGCTVTSGQSSAK